MSLESRLHQQDIASFTTGRSLESCLSECTDLAVLAHPDDLEISLPFLVSDCHQDADRHLCLVLLTDGRGSPRGAAWKTQTDDEFVETRTREQTAAAEHGEFSFIQLRYRSDTVRDMECPDPTSDLVTLLSHCDSVANVYTHALTEHHSTHRRVGIRTTAALRQLRSDRRPIRFEGGHCWGAAIEAVPARFLKPYSLTADDLQFVKEVLVKHESQVAVKNYCAALDGRLRTNAVLQSDPYAEDEDEFVCVVMDMIDLLKDESLEPFEWIQSLLHEFASSLKLVG